MNDNEMTLRRTRSTARSAAADEGPPMQTTSQELLAQAHGFSHAAREADRKIQAGADALERLRKRAQRGGQ